MRAPLVEAEALRELADAASAAEVSMSMLRVR